MNDAKMNTPLVPSRKPLALACALVSLGLIGVLAAPSYAATQLVDQVSVLVNDAAITEGDLRQAVKQLRAKNPKATPEQLRKRATEELIMLSLQEQEAKRMGLSVDSATLDRAMQNLAQQNNASLTNFRKKVVAQGLSWNELRESIRLQILLDRLREREVMRRIRVSDQEIEDYLDTQAAAEGKPQYDLEHFVVPLPSQSTVAGNRRAEEAVSLLQKELGNKHSAEQVMAVFRARNMPLEGGALGWRSARDLPEPMNNIVPKLMIGEASEPVVDAQGVHILRLKAVRRSRADTVEQSRARHILIKLNPLRDAEQARHQLELLRQQVTGGEDFAALASKHSEDYGSGVMGGDLGWFGPGAMVPAFEKNLKLLAPGQLSQPFESPFGWHLVKLEGRRHAEASETERRKSATAAIAEQKRAKTTQEWLQRLRDQAYLEYPNDE